MTRLEIRPSLLLVFTLALSCRHILDPPGLFCRTKVTHGRVGGGGGCCSGGYVNEKRKKKKFTREFPFYQGKNSRLPSERDWRGSNGLMTPLASSPFFPGCGVQREKGFFVGFVGTGLRRRRRRRRRCRTTGRSRSRRGRHARQTLWYFLAPDLGGISN